MDKLEEVYKLAKEVGAKDISLPEIIIETKAIDKIAPYLKSNQYQKIVIVADENTYKVVGKHVQQILSDDNHEVETILLTQTKHGQVIADEATLVQLLVEAPSGTDVLLAVGSGTIHDVVRFAGHKLNIPFISIPTAASVDGFASKGAPLILRGVKQTIQTASPVAIFADLNILMGAPKEMTAAGFGDILGKYTSLLDWKISDWIGGEPYNQLAADMTRRSLESCVNNVDKIAAGDEAGMKILIQSLIESGLVMLVLDFSRPASGGEHHLSHFWEMDLLKNNAEQLLHGAKVGVTTTIIAELYKDFAKQLDTSSIRKNQTIYKDKLDLHWEKIKYEIEQLPTPIFLRELLKSVGGPASPEELNVPDDLVEESLNQAYKLRDRCTGLLLINQLKTERIKYSF
ncbi:sn-glycerol-1-phosphate dehydrogenase [Aquibacillus rhizosphaerae]|uniref:Sn-glycerol-1-phosphate dehydrogenase n=1 Tax=Aquibacillus rhizosphaerae TaxID=3051431 RepID=A0ABT7L357_9BACI|nr:sn-glycerol-1-phosphate dehydrogenase [Aquibacillus sp. LR5S19]MDL4839031.1 sn-glycerol-1-phosphate dehydrogenase [Aquibacillus sp. LR5S19]